MNTHNYTKKYWGHNYSIIKINGEKINICGWGYGLENGDFVLLPNGEGTTRYRIDKIKYETNPQDMWTAEMSFAPRQTP